MPIIYLILVIYSFIASQVHWPFGNLTIIFGMLLLLTDIVIQIVRLAMKKTSYQLLLLSLSLCFLSVGYLFMWLDWPAMKLNAWLCLVLALPGIILSFKLKKKAFVRKLITGFMFILLASISFMKESTFYCFKHNMSVDNPNDSPVFVVHRLAYILYQEGDKKQAEELLESIRQDLNKKTAYFRTLERRDKFMLQIFIEDSTIVRNDLEQLEHGNWSNYQYLWPDDVNYKELEKQ
ncbi:hypothetical protein [Fluviicola taffensis]|uniref:hypothetical protein n=1 Tax=Fluviicola taffensis TaxID=191579 RepID=UPI003137806D